MTDLQFCLMAMYIIGFFPAYWMIVDIINSRKPTNATTYTTTISVTPKCNHDTGGWNTIRFWIFTRRIYVCFKCGKLIYENKWGIR